VNCHYARSFTNCKYPPAAGGAGTKRCGRTPTPARRGVGAGRAPVGLRREGRRPFLLPARLRLVGARHRRDAVASDSPGALHDPGERPVLALRGLLDLLKHVLREVQRLLAGVGHSLFYALRARGRIPRAAHEVRRWYTSGMNENFGALKARLRKLDGMLAADADRILGNLEFARAVSQAQRLVRDGDRTREPSAELLAAVERAELLGRGIR